MKPYVLFFFIVFGLGLVRAEENLQNPFAYSAEGNIYLSSSVNTFALTSGATENLYYYNPRWSNDGKTLAFWQHDNGQQAIFVAPSGEAPRLLVSEADGLAFNARELALAPDGSAVAFFAWYEEQGGVFTASVETGEIRFIAAATNSSIGEAGSFYDPAESITLAATGASLYREQFAIAWGEYGILHTPTNDAGALALSSPEGRLIWGLEGHWQFLLDAEGRHAAGKNFQDEWVSIDVETGEVSLLDLPEGAKPLGWVGDEFFYRTRTELISVTGNPMMLVGNEIFDYNWGFTATSANLNLYLQMPEGEDEMVATLQGYDMGFVEGMAINALLVHYVSSSMPAVLALNEGASADDVRPLLASSEILLLRVAYKEEQPNFIERIGLGSHDAVQSSGEFVLVTE